MSKSHEKIEALFEAAVALESEAQQAEYLNRACPDPEMRREVESLLASHHHPDSIFLDKAATEESGVIESGSLLIGRYKLLEKVGEGGWGVVYVADQTEPVRRRVALKVVKLGMNTRDVIARFEAERQALAMMDHPNIAKVLDAGATDEGRPYFVMELVRGIRITDYCDQANLNMQARLDLFVKVCQAIQHAHQKGIIHRDIKPSNILVTLHDGVPVPKVIDFGIAKAVEGRLTDATVYTQLHQFIGTPAYMSPEQAEMSGLDIDTRSDIYSLGVLLYELLAGKPPFDGRALVSMGLDAMRKTIREKEPARPSTRLSALRGDELTSTAKRRSVETSKLAKIVRGDLDWIVMRCLEKDRTRRYETANGLAVDIQRHLNNEPVTARPPSVVYRFQKTFRRNKLAFTAAAAVVLALVAGLGVSVWQFLEKNAAYQQVVLSEKKEKAARAEAEANARKAEASHQEAEASVARQILQRATERFQVGDAATALSSLAYLLHRQPDHPIAAYRLEAALSSGNFSLPVAALTADLDKPLSEVIIFGLFSGGRNTEHFSPNGQLVVTAEEDNTARIWEARNGAAVGEPMRHPRQVLSVDFSPDSRQVLTACEDGTVQIWDAQTGRALGSPLHHGSRVRVARFSPDGQRVATLADHRTASLWDARSGQLVWGLETNAVSGSTVQVSSDGAHLLAGYEDRIELWDTASHRQLLNIPFGFNPVKPEMSAAGCILFAVGWQTRTVHLQWPMADPPIPPITLDAQAPLNSARFSPDGRWLVTASNADKSARVWDARTGDRLYQTVGHKDGLAYAAFSPDGQRLVTCSLDYTARIWDARTGKPISEPLQHGFAVIYAEFSADGQRLLTWAGGVTWLWDVRLGQPASLRLHHDAPVEKATFSSDGRRVLTVSADQWARLWDASTGRFLDKRAWAPEQKAVLSPDGRRIAAVSPGIVGLSVRVWDVETEQYVGLPVYLPNSIVDIQFSPDGKRLVTATWIDGVYVHSAETGEIEATWDTRFANCGVSRALLSPDGRQVLTVHEYGFLHLRDAQTGQVLSEPIKQGGGSRCVARFSPDGSRIAVSSQGGSTRIYDARTAKRLDLAPMQHPGTISQGQILSFSPDSMRLATAAGNNAYLYDVRTGAPLVPAMLHEANVASVQFDPTGTRLLTTCADGRARLWDATTGFLLDDSFERVKTAEFSPDGTKVLTSCADDTAVIWNLPWRGPEPARIPDWLGPLAEAVAGQQIDDPGIIHRVDLKKLIRLRHQLGGIRSTSSGQAPSTTGQAGQVGSAGWAQWAQWFFANSASRRIAADPSSLPVSAYVDHLVEIGTVKTLREALQLRPAHPQAHERLAVALSQKEIRTDSSEDAATPKSKSPLDPASQKLRGLRQGLLIQEFVHRYSGGASAYARRRLSEELGQLTEGRPSGPDPLVPRGSVWKYFDRGSDLGTEWRGLGYDDSTWPEGPADLGYDEADPSLVTTPVSYGSDSTNKHITTYFRHSFPAPAHGLGVDLMLHLRRDDGAIVYLNGQEIVRDNLPTGPVSAKTRTPVTMFGPWSKNLYAPFEFSKRLQPGTNVLAVEIHQDHPGSDDLHFDLELVPHSPPLSYFRDLSPDEFQAEVQICLAEHVYGLPWNSVPDYLKQCFEFAYSADPASDPESIKSNWRNWEVRAQLQADLMTHTAEARQAYETCLNLLRTQPASETIAHRIETVRKALERLPN